MGARIVVLISGSGSNLQAFIDAAEGPDCAFEISAVISNKADAFGLERARRAGIATAHIDHRQFPDRESFDAELRDCVAGFSPDLVILAGFMRILTPVFVGPFEGKMLNIHPSLLPKYPGLNTHQRAIDAGDQRAGATVHFVSQELDGGPPVIQASVAIKENDSADDLAKRVLEQEHRIYPLAAQWFAEGRLRLGEQGALLDGEALPATGVAYSTADSGQP